MKKILLIIAATLLSFSLHAMELAGVKIAEHSQVNGQNLLLNGAGIRTKLFFKVYVAALYLPQQQTASELVIADAREHRIALHLLRELSSDKLLHAFNEAIKDNHSPAELAALAASLQQMSDIFAAVKEVKTGDVVTLDYVPASGTQISLNGSVRGTIVGLEFNRALLRIWLGNKPVQNDLKKALLHSE